ncbi:MAG: POTRA domain-containing protein, partial [Gammaproteobacteria bacterium]
MPDRRPASKTLRLRLFFAIAGIFAAMLCRADERALKPLEQRPPAAPGPAFVLPPLDQRDTPDSPPPGLKITLKRIEVRGNTVFDAARIRRLLRPYLNRPLDAAELETLRYNLSRLYVENGYINSGALIPRQRLQDGVLRIDVIEGRLERIDIEGQGWLHPDYIR